MLADIQEYGKQERAARVPVVEKVTPGPTRVGTRWHEVIRMAPRVTFTIWSEVVAIEQDRLLDERFWSWWFRGRLAYTLTSRPGDATTNWLASRPPSHHGAARAGQSAGRAHAHSG